MFYKMFRNKEIKTLTFKISIVLILGIILGAIAVESSIKGLNESLINQNASIISSINSGKSTGEIVKNFYETPDSKDIKRGKEILNSYGYNKELELSSNDILKEFRFNMLLKVIVIITLIIIGAYFISFNLFKDIYNYFSNLAKETEKVIEGKSKIIKNVYKEGEIYILTDRFNKMTERVDLTLKRLEDEKLYLKDYLADISHQLKTPLASLFMFNDLLSENENMPLEQKRLFLDKGEEQLERMDWLIQNLLKAGRLEANVIEFNKRSESLNKIIYRIENSFRDLAKAKDISINIYLKEEVYLVCDDKWLEEALSNIVKNCIEYTRPNGYINLDVIETKLQTKIIIEDNGIGIEKENINKIFNRFYKGDNKEVNPKSIGIGLYLTKNILKNMGGEIKVFSEVSKGSKFIITFIKESH
ncbi:HAMP domain-containing histidine kinase [Clostridium sp. LY3-2]|uniref:sensor histidine kinase n=1 Tax=Clostridium sp. LY3-2 TaxID=2942482 RepID=UPI0021531A41|nr:HAMP domain-containing sensor histidine kinase [Clostridium sp. LY3-2]MCR6513973.1 HAMP domain-containing histidine kinase [Clostridium sp. LY3-2]